MAYIYIYVYTLCNIVIIIGYRCVLWRRYRILRSSGFSVEPISSSPEIFLITFRPSDKTSRFFRAGSEIILSMQFVDKERCLALLLPFSIGIYR